MGLRFTDPKKWRSTKFRKLQPLQKLLLIFIKENCDLAGFLEIDEESISFHTGIDFKEVEELIGNLDGLIVHNGWIFVKGFLKEQKNLPLKSSNNAHKGIMTCFSENYTNFSDCDEFIDELGSFESYNSSSENPTNNPINNKRALSESVKNLIS